MSKAAKRNINKGVNRAQPYPPITTPDTTKVPMTSPVSPSINRSAGPWSAQDDVQLKQARQRGMSWAPIAEQYFPTKTANACRKRHERLMEKNQANDDWPPAKLDEMAKWYLKMREPMWRMVSSRFGEDWETVETKCMGTGVMTLKNASRRHKASNPDDTSPNEDIFDDSGLGLGPDPDRHSNSDMGHSHSSRRSTYSNASSYALTPMLPAASSPQPSLQQYQHPSPRTSHQPYQFPSALIQQQKQQNQNQNHTLLPSIRDVLATTANQTNAVSTAI